MRIDLKGALLRSRGGRQGRQDGGGRQTFDGDGVIMIFGLPRSGTTWLGKIFDSHPDVLYRHEPDMLLNDERLPWYDGLAERDGYLGPAREYLERLGRTESSHAAGPPPYFRKSYRDPMLRLLRIVILFGVRKVEGAPGGTKRRGRITVPDFVSRGSRSPQRLVFKSIDSLGRARLFADAWPKSRSIVILRHPCAQVGSLARGMSLGTILDPGPPMALARSRRAEMMGLRIDAFSELSPIEQLAWTWAFWSQLAVEDLDGVDAARIIRYEDLTADPERVSRDLFAFAGLSWHPQTAAFVEASTSRDGSSNYFGVMREAAAAANRWREEVSAQDQKRILDIACRVPAGALFAEPSGVVNEATPLFDLAPRAPCERMATAATCESPDGQTSRGTRIRE